MIQGIIGKKLGMTQVFREDGELEAVTAIEAGPCTVMQVKDSRQRRLQCRPARLRRSQDAQFSARRDTSRDWDSSNTSGIQGG